MSPGSTKMSSGSSTSDPENKDMNKILWIYVLDYL